MRWALLIGCLLVACVGDDDDSGSGSGSMTCTHAGTDYEVGDTFPAGDGCNTCSCTDQGVACTIIGC
jgi:hypothetical protein